MAIFVNGTVGGDSNIIETVKVNNTALPVSNKAVNVDLTNLAPKASPALTGTPTAPTAASGTNTTQIATTAFVQDAVNDSKDYVIFNEFSSYDSVYSELGSGKQLLFDSGNLDVITGYGIDNHDSIYLSYISTQVIDVVESDELASADYELRVEYHKVDTSDNWTTETNSDNFAHLLSPNFTGIPTAPTAASGTNTTQLATTAFVQDAVEEISSQFSMLDLMGLGDVLITANTITDGRFKEFTSSTSYVAKSDSQEYFDLMNASGVNRYTPLKSNSSYIYSSNMCKFNSYYVIYESATPSFWYTTDPTGTWYNKSFTSISADSSSLKKVNNYLVHMGSGGYSYCTTPSGTWTKVTVSSTQITDMVYYNGYYVAGYYDNTSTGEAGYMYTSSISSSSWTKVALFSNYDTPVRLAVFHNQLIIAGTLATSTTAQSKSFKIYKLASIADTITSIASTNYASNTDGGIDYFFEFNDKLYISCASSSSSYGTILSTISYDGTNVTANSVRKTSTDYSAPFKCIGYRDNKVYLQKYNTVYFTSDLSSDFTTWGSVTLPADTDWASSNYSFKSFIIESDITYWMYHYNGSTKSLGSVYSAVYPDSYVPSFSTRPKYPSYSINGAPIDGVNYYIKYKNSI